MKKKTSHKNQVINVLMNEQLGGPSYSPSFNQAPPHLCCVDHDGGVAPEPGADEVVVHRPRGQQGGDGRLAGIQGDGGTTCGAV